MEILTENGAFQNFGLCITKKCTDLDQIDDFLQLCTQLIFYEKINLSGLVPDYVRKGSEEVIAILNRNNNFFDIAFQNIEDNDTSELIHTVASKYYDKISYYLEGYVINISNPEGLLPKLNNELFEKVKKITEEIRNGSIDNLLNGDLYHQSTFSTDSALVKIISCNENIFHKLFDFSKKYDWTDTTTLQLISDLRILTNKIFAEKNGKLYSPAVRRGRKEKQILERIFLSKIEQLTRDATNAITYPDYIQMPSIKDYLTKKGNGNPDDIVKEVSLLREEFKHVRKYIQEMGKNSLYDSLQALNEISTKVIEEAKIGRPSRHKKVIENIQDINLGPISVSIPDIPEMNRKKKLGHCVLAFTETIDDMIKNNDEYPYKKLKKNCMKE